MEDKYITRILKVTVILIFCVAGLLHLTGTNLLSMEGLKKISIFFSVTTLFWAFYFKVGWKLPLLKYIAYKENLNGTWFGQYKSIDRIEGKQFEGEIGIVVKQTFLNIAVISYTQDFISYSYGASILYNIDHQNNKLVYLYSQKEFNKADENTRKGTSELQLIKGEKEKKLFGNFWTNHNSKGSLDLVLVNKKHFNSFEDIKEIL